MTRIWILLGYTFLFFYLHVTGNISKYINLKYSFLSFIAIFVFLFFLIAQCYFAWKEESNEDEFNDICDCGMDHAEEKKSWKRFIAYPILIFPIVTALVLPIATLDSSIVAAKGFNFDMFGKDADPNGFHQFLAPDTSIFYGQDGYEELMKEAMGQFADRDPILLNDEDYLLGMETIYKNPGYFMGKTIGFKGFTFKDEETDDTFLFRFGLIHCVADSGVFGMLLDLPKGETFDNDEWIDVEGKLDSIYYQPLKKTVPVLKVKKIISMDEPEEPYVYRTN
ncbi:TIGR03943 family protein [Sporosarcina sp. BI001-red]|uniref:TIGR03943 family putative permease subunit n=1 Tax=Sporosarcina sp. BI001-red TaxID=2282866 RepID=UPI000E227124|nr:TIGR03943 family protein [Sporosarcina sp. BI001-red]REB04712.1 TIGR03943 family protein [Sporosarcina sp. BI001-red]